MTITKDVRDITRVPLTHNTNIESELRGDVLAKAFKEFDYVGESFEARGPLAKALVACDIAPLDTAQVQQYKESKVRTGYSSRVKREVIAWSVWAVVVGAVWMYIHPASMNIGDISAFIAATSIGTLLIMVIVWETMISSEMPSYTKSWGWSSFALGREDSRMHKYTGYVPVHVLNMALQVRLQCPNASMIVDELSLVIDEVKRPLPDPFLKVTLGSETYYIAVWDEREFEAKM